VTKNLASNSSLIHTYLHYVLACLLLYLYVYIGIISYPPACESPLRPNTLCERGQHADLYRLAFLDVWVWIVFAVLVVSMLLIYTKLSRLDRASSPRVLQLQSQTSQQELQQQQLLQQQKKKSIMWSFYGLSRPSSSSSSSSKAPPAAAAVAAGAMGESTAETFNISSPQHLPRQQAVNNMSSSNKNMTSSSSSFRETATATRPKLPQQQELAPAASAAQRPASPRTSASRSMTNLSRLKHQFAVQALLYALAFFITFFFDTLALLLRAAYLQRLLSPCIFLANVFLPLQGFWNAFIYIRPRYLRYRKKQRDEQERLQVHIDKQRAEASALAHAAHLGQQRGLAFLQALSAKAEDDEYDEAEAEEEGQQEEEEEGQEEEKHMRYEKEEAEERISSGRRAATGDRGAHRAFDKPNRAATHDGDDVVDDGVAAEATDEDDDTFDF
jgi:hypothetical protein